MTKQSAAKPGPQFSSLGLRVLMGQNSWKRVGLAFNWLARVSVWGGVLSWLSRWVAGFGPAAEVICMAALG